MRWYIGLECYRTRYWDRKKNEIFIGCVRSFFSNTAFYLFYLLRSVSYLFYKPTYKNIPHLFARREERVYNLISQRWSKRYGLINLKTIFVEMPHTGGRKEGLWNFKIITRL